MTDSQIIALAILCATLVNTTGIGDAKDVIRAEVDARFVKLDPSLEVRFHSMETRFNSIDRKFDELLRVVTDHAPKTDATGFPQLTSPGLVLMEGLQGKAVVSFLTARAQPVSALVETLSGEFSMPVSDKTGLIGRYDFTLEFAPQAPGALPPDTSDESAANLISAVPQQVGLKPESKKLPVDVLIVDSADKIPTENQPGSCEPRKRFAALLNSHNAECVEARPNQLLAIIANSAPQNRHDSALYADPRAPGICAFTLIFAMP